MKIDVVIPIYRNAALVEACLRSVKDCSDEHLGLIYLIDDRSPEPAVRELLERWRQSESNVRLLSHDTNRGFVRAANLGLAASGRDVVVLNSDTRVTRGWLSALATVFEREPRCAAVSPLSNNAGPCSVPTPGAENELDATQVAGLQLGGLPVFSEMPTAPGFCLLLRREALTALGAFDPAYGRGYHEENDWCQRARAAGWRVGRANRAFVFHLGKASFGAERAALDQANGWRLVERYPRFFDDTRRFDDSVWCGLAARAVRASLGCLGLNDFAVVTVHQPTGARDAPWIAKVGPGDLQHPRLEVLLSSAQGAVIDVGARAAIVSRFPTLRVIEGEATIAFLTQLALNPDMAALARQAG